MLSVPLLPGLCTRLLTEMVAVVGVFTFKVVQLVTLLQLPPTTTQ